MRSITAILTIGVIFGFGAVSATGTTYYFDRVTEGDWDYPDNWTPNGTPEAGDTAVIVDGYTCLVEDADQEAASITLAGDDSVLGIVGRELTASVVSVNGTLYFEGEGSCLRSDGVLSIGSTWPGQWGLITARQGDGYGPGVIEADDGVYICAGAYVTGTLEILSDTYIVNYGTVEVRDSADTLEIGRAESGGAMPALQGSGEFWATAGTLRFGKLAMGYALTGAWIVGDDGTMDVTEYVSCVCLPAYCPVVHLYVAGGEVEVATDLLTRGGLEFTGGTIEVQPGKTAEFLYDPPEEEE